MTNHNDTENEGLETRTRIFLEGEAQQALPIIDKTERTGLTQNGLREDVTIRLKYATGCHHLLHTAQEAGAACGSCSGSKNILCAECSKSDEYVCSACHLPTCSSCQREATIDGKRKMVCISCCRALFRRRILDAVKWAAIVLGLLMLLQILAR